MFSASDGGVVLLRVRLESDPTIEIEYKDQVPSLDQVRRSCVPKVWLADSQSDRLR
jgi:hypothetical protein